MALQHTVDQIILLKTVGSIEEEHQDICKIRALQNVLNKDPLTKLESASQCEVCRQVKSQPLLNSPMVQNKHGSSPT